MILGGRAFPGAAVAGIKQGPRANSREDTLMLTVVNPEDPAPAASPAPTAVGGS